MKLIRRAQGEDGFALATAMLIMFIALLLGLATLQTVNAETHQTGHENAGEAAFNLAESVLSAESLQLQTNWPSTSTAAYPTTCNQSTTTATRCPGPTVTSSISQAGGSFANPTWNVKVIDDGGTYGSNYYSDSLATNPTTWDSNADNRVWVRASATVWGQTKTVVAQVVRQLQTLNLPLATITAGGVQTENNGSKVIIEATDPNSGITGPLNLRCTPTATQPTNGDTCTGWDQSKGQLDPQSSYTTGYVDPQGGMQALSNGSLNQLRTTAIAMGTGHYYNNTCPTSLTGLVFVDGTVNCTMTTGTYNSDASPGALIFANGTLEFNGNVVYYGIIYMANQSGSLPTSGNVCGTGDLNTVITVHGGAQVYGGIFVDRCGSVDAGEAQFDVDFDSSAFSGFKAYAIPALANNTFRIIPTTG